MKLKVLALLLFLVLPAASPASEDAEAPFKKALDQLLRKGYLGDTSTAERYLLAALERQPKHLEALWQLLLLKFPSPSLRLTERSAHLLAVSPAFAHLAKVAQESKKQAFLHYATAIYASQYKAYERALKEIDRALDLEPKSSRYLFAKGKLLIGYGEWIGRDEEIEKGIKTVKQARDLSKTYPDHFSREADYHFQIAWGTALLSKPRWKKVAEHYLRYIELSEESVVYAFAWNNLSIAYRELGECDKAKGAAESALKVMKFGAAQSNLRYAEFCLEMQKIGVMAPPAKAPVQEKTPAPQPIAAAELR